MKRSWKIAWLTISFVVVAIAIVMLLNPLRLPDKALHRWLLMTVPIGSDIEHLQKVAQEQEWRINSMWDGNRPHSDWGGIDGAKIVFVYLGGYGNHFKTNLDSFWAFDEAGHLIDVKVRRLYTYL
jgi:hypothetical protein